MGSVISYGSTIQRFGNTGSVAKSTDLEGEVMPLADVSGEVDHGLHPLYLSLDLGIKVLFLHFWEAQEVDRTRIWDRRIFRYVVP